MVTLSLLFLLFTTFSMITHYLSEINNNAAIRPGMCCGRQVRRDISVLSFAMATIEITCQGCELDYWEVIAKFHKKTICVMSL